MDDSITENKYVDRYNMYVVRHIFLIDVIAATCVGLRNRHIKRDKGSVLAAALRDTPSSAPARGRMNRLL
jgi:hypothetical protein